jgi:hypothetical protein
MMFHETLIHNDVLIGLIADESNMYVSMLICFDYPPIVWRCHSQVRIGCRQVAAGGIAHVATSYSA